MIAFYIFASFGNSKDDVEGWKWQGKVCQDFFLSNNVIFSFLPYLPLQYSKRSEKKMKIKGV
jgi:hypothetical protein